MSGIKQGRERHSLHRAVGRFGFFALAFGSMIGVGWVTAVGGWLTQAGVLGAVIAFAAGGALMLLIGLCYAEATPMLPLAGGEVAYAYAAFGTFKAFIVGWCLAVGYVAISGFEAISVAKVLGYMIPSLDSGLLYEVGGSPVYASHLILALGFTAVITWMHHRGVAIAAAAQRWLVIAFAVVCVIFIVAGFAGGSPGNIGASFGTAPGGIGGILIVLVTVPFWFVGFDTIPQAAEEADVSVKPVQLAGLIVASIAAAALFYVLIVASVAMVVPREALAGAALPAAHAFEVAFGSPLLARGVLAAAVLGLLTSWNGFFLAASRVIFALGRGGILPHGLGRTHPRHGTPAAAVLLTGALTILAPLLGRDALIAIVNAGSFFIAVAFLGVSLSLIRLRRSRPDLDRPFSLRGGNTVPALAALGSGGILLAMIVPGSPAALAWPREIAILGLFAILGLGLWIAAARSRQLVSEKDRDFLILERFARQTSAGDPR